MGRCHLRREHCNKERAERGNEQFLSIMSVKARGHRLRMRKCYINSSKDLYPWDGDLQLLFRGKLLNSTGLQGWQTPNPCCF